MDDETQKLVERLNAEAVAISDTLSEPLLREAAAALTRLRETLHQLYDRGAILALRDANDRAEKAEAALAQCKLHGTERALAARDKSIAEFEAQLAKLR